MTKKCFDDVKRGVLFSQEARERLFEGLNVAAEAVACTLGPRGRTVLVKNGDNAPIVTKDGVTVAKFVKLSDPVQSMGAQLLKEAAVRTNDVAGDGTTTSSVLTQSLVKGGLKLMSSGHDPILLKKGVEIGTKFVIETLRKKSQTVDSHDSVKHVGTISANGDEKIGEIIAQAVDRVGRDGVITVEDAKGTETSLDVVEGMLVDRGYVSPYFVTNNEKMNASYKDALVLVTDRKISSLAELVPLLESVSKSRSALLIVADEIEGEALQALVVNKTKGVLQTVAIRSPGYGKFKEQMLHDIAVLVGTTVVSPSTGLSLEKVTVSDLGKCKRVVVDSKSTTIVGTGKTKKEVEKRVEELRCQLRDVTLDAAEISYIRSRMARLSSGVAIVRVGGATEIEMIEKKYRIEDSLNATRAAIEEGIVAGGGMSLYDSSLELRAVSSTLSSDPDVRAGIDVVVSACQSPLRRIVSNAGLSPDVVAEKLSKRESSCIGWDADKCELCDLFDRGIIDPTKVERCAIENASSVACAFLTLDAVVFDEEAKEA